MSKDDLEPFLQAQAEQGLKDSSGKFTIERGRAGRLLARQTLSDPNLALLKAVQAAVALGCTSVAWELRPDRLEVFFARPRLSRLPVETPEVYLGAPGEFSLSLALWTWCTALEVRCNSGPWVDLSPHFNDEGIPYPNLPPDITRLSFRLRRQVSRPQVRAEMALLRQRCRYCPIPVAVEGEPVQPVNFACSVGGSAPLLPRHFHLAELYFAPSGAVDRLAFLRQDRGARSKNWVDTGQTLYRNLGGAKPIGWRYPQKVAGVVARRETYQVLHCQAAVFVSAEVGAKSLAEMVYLGVTVRQVEIDLPGLHLIFDVSHLPVDLSGLELVVGAELESQLEHWLGRTRSGLKVFSQGMMSHLRQGSAFSWQLRREIGVAVGVFGVAAVTGAATFFPLPFLALPWVAWYHGSRRKALGKLEERCQEIVHCLESEPIDHTPR